MERSEPIFTASLLEFDVRLGEPEANLNEVLAMLERLDPARPHLVVVPEVFTTNFSFRDAGTLTDFTPRALDCLAKEARRRQIAIAGSVIEAVEDEEGLYENRAFFLDESGNRLTRYAKRHLIHLTHEHLFYRSGTEATPPVFHWRGVPIAMAICYDIRFPEAIGRAAFAGAEVLIVPAQWPVHRAEHWHTLLRARAIENQMFVLGCNRIGEIDGMPFVGGSEILGPWGESLAADTHGREGIVSAQIDLRRVDEVRRRLTAFFERCAEESSEQ